MATQSKPPISKATIYTWEGKNKRGLKVTGEVRAVSLLLAKAELRNQGIETTKIRKKSEPLFGTGAGPRIRPLDIAIFTRQLATMLGAGIPVVQSLEVLGRGSTKPRMQILILGVRADVESGIPLSDAFRKSPIFFNDLYCNLVQAGEQAGQLDIMLARLAMYREKTEMLKARVKKALFYPMTVLVIAFIITAGMLIFIVPQFAQIYKSFGAELPYATQVVVSISNAFVSYWWLIFSVIGGGITAIIMGRKRSKPFAEFLERMSLKIPVIGKILKKAIIARFSRTLSTTFAAGLPLVDALTSVAGATGNILYSNASLQIRDAVATGQQLNTAVEQTNLFPPMVLQMISIGEESGSLEFMLSKIADFYEEEVDTAVNTLNSLLEPIIMVILGVVIGGLVIAMYMPIFKLGSVIS